MKQKLAVLAVTILLLGLFFAPIVSAETCSFINITQGPPGDTGPQGIPGINGTPGADGQQGLQGIPGINGTPGEKGDTGLQGIQGIQGIQGNPGATGANGTPGDSGTIAINYTFSLPTGSEPTIVNIGNAINAIFDIGIPKGDQGTNGTSATVAVNYTFTGLPGTEANVTNVGNETAALFDITIPQGLTGETGASGATGGTGGQILYFRHAASTDPITYETLFPTPAGSAEDDESASLTAAGGQVLIDAYVTDIGYPALTELPAGLWRFRTFHYVSNANGNTNAVFKVYNRTAGGSETLLFTATSEDINALAIDEYLTSYVQTTAYSVSLTDRIVVKVYGQTGSSSARVFHFVYEGSTHTSHIQTTLESAPATSLSFSVVAGETLYKGEAVYISGASGGNPIVSGADNTNTAKSRVVGLMAGNTASGAVGQVRRAGALTSVDTRSTSANINPLGQTWSAGDLLFATTGGGLTNVRPTSGRSVKAGYSLVGSSANDVLMAYPMENPVWSTAASGESIVDRLGDSAGVTKLSIRNYTNSEVAYIDSYGAMKVSGDIDIATKRIYNPLDIILNATISPFYSQIRMVSNNTAIVQTGGTSQYGGSTIVWYGGEHATYPGRLDFRVPNAAKTQSLIVALIDGNTDTPHLNMNAHRISNILSPTTTNDALTYNAWQTVTPTITSSGCVGGVSPTWQTKNFRYTTIGKSVQFALYLSTTDSNACTGQTISIPNTSANIAVNHHPYGWEGYGTGGGTTKDPMAYIQANSGVINFLSYSAGTDGQAHTISLSGIYEKA